MHHFSRPLRTLTIATLLALALAACGAGETEPQHEPSSSPVSEPEATDEATADAVDATPRERIEAYFAAADANAEQGWTDSSYVREYLTPEIAEGAEKFEEENAETGATTSGGRVLSHWRTVEETDAAATVQFCDDVTGITATKDGEPFELDNPDQPLVAQYTLVKENSDAPWMIDERGYYRDGTTCDDHFAE